MSTRGSILCSISSLQKHLPSNFHLLAKSVQLIFFIFTTSLMRVCTAFTGTPPIMLFLSSPFIIRNHYSAMPHLFVTSSVGVLSPIIGATCSMLYLHVAVECENVSSHSFIPTVFLLFQCCFDTAENGSKTFRHSVTLDSHSPIGSIQFYALSNYTSW